MRETAQWYSINPYEVCLVVGCDPLCLKGLAAKPPRECMKKYVEATSNTLRIRAMRHLRDPPECTKCRVRDLDMLSIDHIHNDGNAERDAIGNDGIYQKILSLPPEEARLDYQILCRNHNWKKYIMQKRQQPTT